MWGQITWTSQVCGIPEWEDVWNWVSSGALAVWGSLSTQVLLKRTGDSGPLTGRENKGEAVRG